MLIGPKITLQLKYYQGTLVCYEYTQARTLEKLGLTKEKLFPFSIVNGNDYSNNVPGFGIKKNLEFFKGFKLTQDEEILNQVDKVKVLIQHYLAFTKKKKYKMEYFNYAIQVFLYNTEIIDLYYEVQHGLHKYNWFFWKQEFDNLKLSSKSNRKLKQKRSSRRSNKNLVFKKNWSYLSYRKLEVNINYETGTPQPKKFNDKIKHLKNLEEKQKVGLQKNGTLELDKKKRKRKSNEELNNDKFDVIDEIDKQKEEKKETPYIPSSKLAREGYSERYGVEANVRHKSPAHYNIENQLFKRWAWS